jgi:hypothetical protein
MKQTRAQMLNFLLTARPDVSRDFWETFDNANLALQVQCVLRQIEQQTADQVAMM